MTRRTALAMPLAFAAPKPPEPTFAELKINVLDACVNLLDVCGPSERREQIRGELLEIRSAIARKAGLAGGRGRKKEK